MEMLRECDSELDNEIQPSDVDHVLRESNSNDQILPLDVSVLIHCGQLVSDYFKSYRDGEVSDEDDDYSTVNSLSLITDYGETYMDVAMRQTFNWLYDTMLLDMEKADLGYRTQRKLKFYDDLHDFVHYHRLHEINRFVFGDGPCGDWDPNTVAALETVRAWRIQYQDEIERVPDSLIETYDMTAKNPDIQPFDVAMVAFAVFGFLLGYDSAADFELMYSFREINAIHGPTTTDFRRVRNSVSRNVRVFLEIYGSNADREYFEQVLADNAGVVALCEWMYDLAAARPDFADRLAANPFHVDGPCHRADGTLVASSTVAQLRVFHRWAAREIFALFRGVSQRRISLLDKHIQRCLSSRLSTKSWLKLFNNAYAHMLFHFTNVLNEYDCPNGMLKTLRSTWNQKQFKNLIRHCIKTLYDRNSNLHYRDNSTDSNDSFTHSNSSSTYSNDSTTNSNDISE